MRALTMDELEFVSGGFDEGSQLMGPDQFGQPGGFGGGGQDFGNFGGGFGDMDSLWNWPWSCDAACQQRKREEEARRREAERRRQEALEQLRNNRMAACVRAGGSYSESQGAGSMGVEVSVDVPARSGSAGFTVRVTAPNFQCTRR